VLRDQHRTQSAFAAICSYIAQNPVRSDLAASARAWPFTGCVIPGCPSMHPLNDDFWETFWRIYNAAVVRGGIGKVSR
jgi:putative transposase